jgi:hypothetical protein
LAELVRLGFRRGNNLTRILEIDHDILRSHAAFARADR